MASINTDDFFESKRSTSEIKSEIFLKYFKFWCGVLLYGQKYKKINEVMYIDMFSGPGKYDDGAISTPIKVLESIYASKGSNIDLNASVKTFFNDEKKKIVDQLEENLKNLSYYHEIRHKPVILNKSASIELMNDLLKEGIPSLTFIDPFGYSFSMEMLLSSIKEWGSDLFMLFNINRIRAAINNPTVENLMNEIFQNELCEIKDFYRIEKNPNKREQFIINKFENLFSSQGYYIFRFRILFPNKNQTSHYLYLITKVKLAYYKIKEIMKEYSDYQPDGVPVFSANDNRFRNLIMFFPDNEKYSIVNLESEIIKNKNKYNGHTVDHIYEEHSINTNYIKVNYKAAIENLWKKGSLKLYKNNTECKRLTYNSCTIHFEI